MQDSTQPEAWTSGDSYEAYVGRWSRLVAQQLLAWLAAPPHQRWLDVGCGTGALSQTILELAAPAELTGIDRSDAYVAFAQAHRADRRAHFLVGDAQALPFEAHRYDVAVSGLMMNFLPESRRMVVEMLRARRLAATVTDYD